MLDRIPGRPGRYARAAARRCSEWRARALRSALPGRFRRTQIVICGVPRGGTSLLYNMMAPALHGFDAAPFEASSVELIGRDENIISKRPLDVLEVRRLPGLNRHEKRLRVIIVLRDPRDVITSVHPNVPGEYFIGYEGSWFVGPRYPYSPSFTSPGLRAVAEAVRRTLSTPGLDSVVVHYEHLVEDPDAVQAALARRLGVSFTRAFREFHREPDSLPYRYAGERRPVDASLVLEDRPVERSRVGRWQDPRHARRLHAQFTGHPELFAIVRAWGYARDDAWFESVRARARQAVPP